MSDEYWEFDKNHVWITRHDVLAEMERMEEYCLRLPEYMRKMKIAEEIADAKAEVKAKAIVLAEAKAIFLAKLKVKAKAIVLAKAKAIVLVGGASDNIHSVAK